MGLLGLEKLTLPNFLVTKAVIIKHSLVVIPKTTAIPLLLPEYVLSISKQSSLGDEEADYQGPRQYYQRYCLSKVGILVRLECKVLSRLSDIRSPSLWYHD